MLKDSIFCALKKSKSDVVLTNCKVVDVFSGDIKNIDVAIKNGKIVGLGDYKGFGIKEYDLKGQYVVPGFIDGHMHIESTMLTIEKLSEVILPRGVTTIIADPHEICNVCGLNGLDYIIKSSKNVLIDVKVMLPSCVPATPFETSGAILDGKIIEKAIDDDNVFGLGEFMDYPSLINADDDALLKIEAAQKLNKIIDGHAPNVSGDALNAYLNCGVKTDHETMTKEEIEEKISKGMYVHLREGSATQNMLTNVKYVNEKNIRRFIMCTDDRHITDLHKEGSMDNALRTAIKGGLNPIWAIIIATLNTAECYGLKNKGAIGINYDADIAVIDNLDDFNVTMVFKNGTLVGENLKPLFKTKQYIPETVLNTINIKDVTENDFKYSLKSNKVHALEIIPKTVITNDLIETVKLIDDDIDLEGSDLLKLCVIERHHKTGNIGKALIKGFGLKNAAIASTVAHDSHNLIVVGDSNRLMKKAVDEIKKINGGLVLVSNNEVYSLPLEIGGLMSIRGIDEIKNQFEELEEASYRYGIKTYYEPFMSLSFMALAVIPHIKVTDKGLWDVDKFDFISLEA